MEDDDGPQILRPVPRRPFEVAFMAPTPPEEDNDAMSMPHHELLASRLSRLVNDSPTNSISSPPSYMNLTSSTLAGIYSPGPSDGGDDDDDDDPYMFSIKNKARHVQDMEAESMPILTPEQPRSRTPLDSPDTDGDFLQMRARAPRRDSVISDATTDSYLELPPAVPLALRTVVLFILGVGYGIIATKCHDETTFGPLPEGLLPSNDDWHYLMFWGVAGVLLGGLLPLFDRVWEDSAEPLAEGKAKSVLQEPQDEPEPEEQPFNMDLALVIRAIGAFVGIAFAIRKLAWDSTLQISAALTLVNPLMWWLIDRSKPGFVFSALVSIIGSALLLGVNTEMVPAPLSQATTTTTTTTINNNDTADASSSGYAMSHQQAVLDRLASSQTMETGIWILSILFCSCLCFGNIGRRLTASDAAISKGRWGGLR